jgi:serine/threonine protein kinase
VFDFFYPNDGHSPPLHIDLGDNGGKECIGQIFFQALEVVHFVHKHGFVHRDIKDDNFLIRRREGVSIGQYNANYIIEIALCDFGMMGYLDKVCSLPKYNPNRYRDSDNINDFAAACDIYSLGEFLHMLIILYHFYLVKDTDVIEKTYASKYKEEWLLIKKMKASIKERPKNMEELKKS